jgi:hypothetical protein
VTSDRQKVDPKLENWAEDILPNGQNPCQINIHIFKKFKKNLKKLYI